MYKITKKHIYFDYYLGLFSYHLFFAVTQLIEKKSFGTQFIIAGNNIVFNKTLTKRASELLQRETWCGKT